MRRRKKATNKTLFNQASDYADDDEEDVYDDNLHLEDNSWICMLTHVRGHLGANGLLIRKWDS